MSACQEHYPAGDTWCTPDGCPPDCAGHECYVCLDRAPVYQPDEQVARLPEPHPEDPCGQCHERCRPDCPPDCASCLPPEPEYDRRIPRRNWRRWGLAYASHWLTGGVLGALVAGVDPVLGIGGLALVIAYQGLEYARRKDTPGRDLLDYGVGFAVGAAAYKAALIGGLL